MDSTNRVSAAKPEAATRLLELIQMRLVSEAIHVVATLGIADLLADAPKHVEQLAEATGASAPSLRRVLRALANFNIFSQDSAGRFALAALGEFLKSDVAGSLQSAALFLGGEIGSNSIRLFLESVMTGESAIQKLSEGKGIFDWLQRDPGRSKCGIQDTRHLRVRDSRHPASAGT
jgi:hypothetical protein